MRKILVLLLCFGLIGCATAASKMNNLSLGMTKPEVIKAMGSPFSTKASEGVEILEYRLLPCGASEVCNAEQYWVTLKSGKVTQYGKAGDFGSAMPTDRREYDIKIQNK